MKSLTYKIVIPTKARPEKDFLFADLETSQFYISYGIYSRDKEEDE